MAGINGIIDRLCDLGAHFTLCDSDDPKRPIERQWQKNRPSSAKVINHVRDGGNIGIIPSSVTSAVLDVDEGDPARLREEYPPYCAYPSRTAGHFHLWYQSRQSVQLYLWAYQGCAGQVIHSTRQISFPTPDHIELVYQGMRTIPHSGLYLPDESIISPPTPPYVVDDAVEGYEGDGDTASNLIDKKHTRRLEEAAIGERNQALFDALRFWAYKQPRPKDARLWEWQCIEQALEFREYLPSLQDFPEREARDTAKSVARFCLEHPQTASSVDSERQQKRGFLSGKRRRQRTHNRDTEIVIWRDSHGKSWGEIGQLMGMTRMGAQKAYARKKGEQAYG